MGIQIILFFSILFQLTAAGLALSLIRVTESHKRTWLFMAAAVLVMVIRRFTILGQVLRDPDSASSRMAGELLALATSILLVLFMLHIRPLLLAIHQAQGELRRRVEERTEQLSRTNAALQNEIALRQSEEKFRTVFEHTPVSLWEEDMSGVKRYIDRLRADGVTDLRTYFTEHPGALRECAAQVKVMNVNQATLDLLEAGSKEALPEGLAWLLDLQPPDVFIEEFAALAEGKHRFTCEEVRRTLTGKQINTLLSMSITPGYEDSWGKVLVYVLDITARKLAEEQAVALALEKERSRILSDFIRDTSHEFGTPLAVMRTSLYMLGQGAQDAISERHLQMANKQVIYVEDLVEGLLTMSRLDSGEAFAFAPVALDHLIESVHERLEDHIQHKRLALCLELDPGLPPINGDSKYLHMALEKLVDNAIRYTPPDGAITIRACCDGDYAVIEVQDTGIGIAKDQHELIFARFYRIDQARSDRGAGLGLPIARKIIDGHRGTITIDSAPGQGSLFRVFLPIPID